MTMQKSAAIILAGGRGKRMGALCQERPKPLLPFAGGLRVVDFTLTNCVHSQIDSIACLTDYHRADMADYLNQWCIGNHLHEKLHIAEPRNGSYSGTADAVYQNLVNSVDDCEDMVLVLAADHIYHMDYRKILAFHQRMEADATVAVIPVPLSQAHHFGIVTIDDNGRIVDFTEKPNSPQSNLVSMGIYVFNKSAVFKHLTKDAVSKNSPHDFGHAIIPDMVRRGRVFAYRFEGYWRDIGTIEAYHRANLELNAKEQAFHFGGDWPISTENCDYRPPEISCHAIVEDSIVSSGCVIEGDVEKSILSQGVRIEEKAVVRNSVIMANTTIGYHSVVDRCVLDENVKVGKFSYLGFEGRCLEIDGGITVVGRDAIVPSFTAVSPSCGISPQLKMWGEKYSANESSKMANMRSC